MSLEVLLGPTPRDWPNVKVEADELVQSWMPAEPDNGSEWFVAGFPQPVYATAVEIAELKNPGAVVKISVAANYAGSKTQWATVWTGAAQEDVPNAPRTFSPAICPAFDVLTQWVRVDLATDKVQGFQWLVAVTLLGTTDGQNDWVLSPTGNLLYVPTPGITLLDGSEIVDSFDVVVMDCSTDEGAPLPVAIPSSLRTSAIGRSTNDETHFGTSQEVKSTVGIFELVEIDLSGPIQHLTIAADEVILADEFQLHVVGSSCFLIEVYYGTGSHPTSQTSGNQDLTA
eukprot:scaffold68413_cov37-Prasinocladus_malaysianus.AAC.1